MIKSKKNTNVIIDCDVIDGRDDRGYVAIARLLAGTGN